MSSINPVVAVAQRIGAILELLIQYIEKKPEGITESVVIRLPVGSEATKLFFKTGYQDEKNITSMTGIKPRSPVSYIRVRNIGPNNLQMSTNQPSGEAQLNTPIYAGTEWAIQIDKNTIWSLFIQAIAKAAVVEVYTDVVVDFIR